MMKLFPFRSITPSATRTIQILGLMLFISLGTATHVRAETTEFTASKDTFLTAENEGQPGDRSHRNYGASHVLRVDTHHDGKKCHVLLAFDLSKIPADAKIEGAMLVCGAPVPPSVGTLEALEIRRLLRDDWAEGDQGKDTNVDHTFTSWAAVKYENGQPTAWGAPGAMGATDSDAKSAIRLSTDVEKTMETGVAVTQLVQDWQAARSGSFGLLLRTTNTQLHYLGWASKETPNAKGPYLVVQWSKP